MTTWFGTSDEATMARFITEAETIRTTLHSLYCCRGRHLWQEVAHLICESNDGPDTYLDAEFSCNICQAEQRIALDGELLTPDGVPYTGNPLLDWVTDADGAVVEVRNGATKERLWPVGEVSA